MSHLDAIACMGGNCQRRESCARYHADFPARDVPWERICSPGKTQMWAQRRPDFPVVAGTLRGASLPAFETAGAHA